MNNQTQFYRLLRIRDRNNLSIDQYSKLEGGDFNHEFSSFIRKIKEIRVLFSKDLNEELVNCLIESLESYSNDFKPADSWTPEITSFSKEHEEEIMQNVLYGEEKAREEYNLIVSNDLSEFSNIRDLINRHIHQLQREIERFNEVPK